MLLAGVAWGLQEAHTPSPEDGPPLLLGPHSPSEGVPAGRASRAGKAPACGRGPHQPPPDKGPEPKQGRLGVRCFLEQGSVSTFSRSSGDLQCATHLCPVPPVLASQPPGGECPFTHFLSYEAQVPPTSAHLQL